MELAKSVDKNSGFAGDVLTFVIVYQNTGSLGASAVVISDFIPAGTIYVAGSASAGGSFDGNKVSWNIGSLVPDANGSVQFKVTVE